MDAEYKSLAAIKNDSWIEHFKQTVGKPYIWGGEQELVLLKNKSGTPHHTTSKDLPLEVVSPVEQFTNMARAEVSKSAPKYKPTSVASKSSGGKGKKRKRKSVSGKKGPKKRKHSKEGPAASTASSGSKKRRSSKKRKRSGDIFG